jgi:glutamine synthetase
MAKSASSGTVASRAPTEVERFLAAHPDTRFIELLLPDTNGIFRGKWVPASGLAGLYRNGVALAQSVFSLDVWGRDVLGTGTGVSLGDPDGLCFPVPGTLLPVPWSKAGNGQVLLTMSDRDRAPYFADPRNVLAAMVERFAELGLTPVAAFELEFYLIDPEAGSAEAPRAVLTSPDDPFLAKRTYCMADLRSFETLFSEIRDACDLQGVPAETVIAEASPGQFEINLVHQPDAMAAADHAVLLKRIIKGVAENHGLIATFMAKPFAGLSGNGMHVHMSLTDKSGANAFADERSGEALRGHAIAGLLETMPESLALMAPSVNSFRRLEPGLYAPVTLCWGHDNRAVAIRIPNGPPQASRVEHRTAGADANPYLVMAAILAGAHRGITAKLEAPEPVEGRNAHHGAGIPALPPHQDAALAAFETSSFIEDYFGAAYRHLYATVKRGEMTAINVVVTELEYRTYLRDA